MQHMSMRGQVGRAGTRTGWKLWALLALLAMFSGAAGQDSRSVRRVEVEQRRALLIGNAAYQHVRPLQNTLADVEALEGALRELGFDVTVERDRGVVEMDAALTKFAKSLTPRDLAFFYFSGHGVEVRGENYLLPVDFLPGSGASTRRTSLAAADVLEELEETARVRVLVLDACRDNPFGDKSANGGLAKMGAASGTLIAYATGAGNVASDNRAGELGLYMTHLVRELRKPGAVELGAVFDQTQESVFYASKLAHPGRDAQDPETSDKVMGKVYLRGGPEVDRPLGGDKDEVKVVRPSGVDRWVTDWQALESLEKSKDPAQRDTVKEYIERYENVSEAGVWVTKAKVLLGILERIAVGTDGPTGPRVQEAGSSWKSSIGMEFVWVPPGRFAMGSPEGEAGREDDERQHGVRISEGFWMGKYEVTQREWELVMGSNPSYYKACRPRCPVENVSWEDVQGFIQKLNEDEREAGSGNRYRLPSEAEWEYAARAGTSGVRYGELDEIAWYDGNSGWKTHPVGEKRANGWGLHDMLGNVWEWTADWYGEEYPSGMVTDPRGPSTGSLRVCRGGGWGNYARYVRSAGRGSVSPGSRDSNIGFRLVRTN